MANCDLNGHLWSPLGSCVFCDTPRLPETPVKMNDKSRIAQLEGLLRELIDIEGPQPGHVLWFRKVEIALRESEKCDCAGPVGPAGEHESFCAQGWGSMGDRDRMLRWLDSQSEAADLNRKRELCEHGHSLAMLAEGTAHCDQCSPGDTAAEPK